MGLAELRNDISRQRDRIKKMKGPPDIRAELSDNLWPWLDAFLETVGKAVEELEEALDDHDEAIDELIERSGSAIQPDLALRIGALGELGHRISADFADFLQTQPETPRKSNALAAIAQYQQLHQVVIAEVAQATLQPSPVADIEEPGAEGEEEIDDDEDEEIEEEQEG